jgi:hypothetical protein
MEEKKRHENPKSHCIYGHKFSFLVAFDSGSFAVLGEGGF